MPGLVRGDAERVVLLVLGVVEEDVAVAVAVAVGVGAAGVVALVVVERRRAALDQADVAHRGVPDRGRLRDLAGEGRRLRGVVVDRRDGGLGRRVTLFQVLPRAASARSSWARSIASCASSTDPGTKPRPARPREPPRRRRWRGPRTSGALPSSAPATRVPAARAVSRVVRRFRTDMVCTSVVDDDGGLPSLTSVLPRNGTERGVSDRRSRRGPPERQPSCRFATAAGTNGRRMERARNRATAPSRPQRRPVPPTRTTRGTRAR